MHIAGQGNVLEAKNGADARPAAATVPFDKPQDGFFETPPPLFPHASQTYSRNPDHPPSLPGSLPSVEAWRSQAAATGVNHRSQSRPSHAARAAYPGDIRQRNGTSVASSTAY